MKMLPGHCLFLNETHLSLGMNGKQNPVSTQRKTFAQTFAQKINNGGGFNRQACAKRVDKHVGMFVIVADMGCFMCLETCFVILGSCFEWCDPLIRILDLFLTICLTLDMRFSRFSHYLL